MDSFLVFAKRHRPVEGWFGPLMLLVAVTLAMVSVLAVGWVREDNVVIATCLGGLLLGSVLGARPLAGWAAWTLIVLYGVLITTLTLAQLWPPINLLFGEWQNLRQFWLDNGALFLDRFGGWIQAVSVDSRTNETIVFAVMLGLLAWTLAAITGWSAFRMRRPLVGLSILGVAVAINGYFGEAPILPIIGFVGAALLATAALHFSGLEIDWESDHVDYSREIRLDSLMYAFLICAALIGLAFVLPAFSPSRLARSILSLPAFASFEARYEQAFAGVEPPRELPLAPGQVGGTGTMPRSFLLGNPPELEKTIMLSAEARTVEESQSGLLGLVRHWRGLSYETYTGQGWSLGEEETVFVEAQEPLVLPEVEETFVIEQEVNWRYDDRILRYTLGYPDRFSQDVNSIWRAGDDFVRATSVEGPRYETISRYSAALPSQLRSVSVQETPPEILERYTQLPEGIPARIGELAAEVTADAQTPYDQAVALERFLRQYPYSLDVTLPPEGGDPVDYFLFDLQMGYCDYYASAMAVMARSLGLPARVATGFLAQPADEEGVQTVRQIDAHSWPEIYFGAYGWVEFEPTSAFSSPHDPLTRAALQEGGPVPEEPIAAETPPIPERAPSREFDWRIAIAILIVAAMIVLSGWWWSRRPRFNSEVDWAYNHLQASARQLGPAPRPSQTPHEFTAALLGELYRLEEERPRLRTRVGTIISPIRQLSELFVRQQYSGSEIEEPRRAVTLWRRIRRPMWMLWLNKRLRSSRK